MADDEQIGRGGLLDQDDAGVPRFHDQLGLGSFCEYEWSRVPRATVVFDALGMGQVEGRDLNVDPVPRNQVGGS